MPPADAVLLQNVAQGLVRFDAGGNIVGGLAERWNVSDDGLSYIFRLASAEWPDGKKITAQQVARLLKRQLAARSRNPLKDSLGAVDDVVAMTDRVIEIQLVAPRPNLLSLLAQPELAILREQRRHRPVQARRRARRRAGAPADPPDLGGDDEEATQREEVLARRRVRAGSRQRRSPPARPTWCSAALSPTCRWPNGPNCRANALALRSGVGPVRAGPGARRRRLDDPDVRHLLAQALDRANF